MPVEEARRRRDRKIHRQHLEDAGDDAAVLAPDPPEERLSNPPGLLGDDREDSHLAHSVIWMDRSYDQITKETLAPGTGVCQY